jgi:NADH dehydrogenase
MRVLILGGGFGGVAAALALERVLARRSDLDVTLVTRDNYFLFTPMLHEVAASDLEVSDVVSPLRRLLGRVKTFVGTVEAIDLGGRCVRVRHGVDGHAHDLGWDHLVLALGASTSFFGLPGVAGRALTVRSIADAMALRDRLIRRLEDANAECTAAAREPNLTFVVAGGGFAGVETLGAINDFVRDAVRFYPRLRGRDVRMVLVTPDGTILPELGPRLGAYAQRKLAARGVEILTGVRVRGAGEHGIELSDGRRIAAGTLVWAAGNTPHPLVAALPVPNRGGRVLVDECLRVPGHPGLWALGDCALVPDARTGGVHPATAQHALRQGRAAGRNVAAAVSGGAPRPFRFTTLGQLAAIGHRTGVANVLGLRFSGFVAWWLWRTVYLSKLPRFEKKVRVALNWTLDLFFSRDFACVTPEPAPGREEARAA